MDEYIASLVIRYRTKGLLLDTVIFLLLAIGTHNRDLVGRDKRLSNYIPEDLDNLMAFIRPFSKLVTTPSIMTEASNLSGHLLGTDFSSGFVQHIARMDERHIPSAIACKSELFESVGLTDSIIADVAKNQYLILTDDFRLASHLEKQRIDVINFNHVPTFRW